MDMEEFDLRNFKHIKIIIIWIVEVPI
jgi:hypothetical protein